MAEYWVTQNSRADGWSVRRPDAEDAESTHRITSEAVLAAHLLVRREGGGVVVVKDRRGIVRETIDVAPTRTAVAG